uniref:G-protein coupled receptors family 1 profile domain-containing protein n=1 Tax=Oryzias latipes TaxID=8090 RepID=A0A3B3H676_ORYLA
MRKRHQFYFKIISLCLSELVFKLTFPLFFLLLFVYCSLLLSNLGVLAVIISEKSLHQPMYLLFCNLSVNDLIGNTVLLPQLMAHILSTERFITYSQYVAICLTVRLTRCRSVLQNAYCDNASLFKLSCENVSVNNIYGLFFTVLLFTCSMGGILLTYVRIAVICWMRKNKELNSRALQTCASHLVLYLIMLWSGFLTIILHRFPNYPDLRKIAYILFHVVPGNLNPIIYGMQTTSLRQKITQLLRKMVFTF